MKKFISINVFIGMLMTLAVIANAAPDGKSQHWQEKAAARRAGAISGENDMRIITPRMNYRERVETQRDIKKRAAAKRNQLMQAADEERQHQPEPARTGMPNVQ